MTTTKQNSLVVAIARELVISGTLYYIVLFRKSIILFLIILELR